MNDDADQREPIIQRARTVAAGFADVGLTRAEELLRRVSPEGREQARREREAKARRHKRLMKRLVVAALAALLAFPLLALVVTPNVALAASSALLMLLMTLVFLTADPRTPGREALTEAALPGLAEEATAWLAAQRRGLPPPALQITNVMCRRLEDLAPQFSRIDASSPAAAALRKLVTVELPNLVEGWRSVPLSLRHTPGADGRSPDEHLVNGLRLIDSELASASEQLSHGTRDEIAVLGRYLELKYDGNRAPPA